MENIRSTVRTALGQQSSTTENLAPGKVGTEQVSDLANVFAGDFELDLLIPRLC